MSYGNKRENKSRITKSTSTNEARRKIPQLLIWFSDLQQSRVDWRWWPGVVFLETVVPECTVLDSGAAGTKGPCAPGVDPTTVAAGASSSGRTHRELAFLSAHRRIKVNLH